VRVLSRMPIPGRTVDTGSPGRFPVRILSVDDNEMMGEALTRWARRREDITVVGALQSGEGVVEAAEREQPDVVLMDYDMPGTDTLGLIHDLTHAKPPLCVLMLSGHAHGPEIMRCLEEGASGYVSKDNDFEYIAAAITRAAGGEMVLCPDAAAALADLP
jgi:two-component system nitrate/nitrite response regulator NarL